MGEAVFEVTRLGTPLCGWCTDDYPATHRVRLIGLDDIAAHACAVHLKAAKERLLALSEIPQTAARG